MNFLGFTGFWAGLIFFSNPFQLGWPYSVSPNIAYADNIDISIFDSQTLPGQSFIIIGDCSVQVKTSKIKDLCYIQKRVEKDCGTYYELEKNCDKN